MKSIPYPASNCACHIGVSDFITPSKIEVTVDNVRPKPNTQLLEMEFEHTIAAFPKHLPNRRVLVGQLEFRTFAVDVHTTQRLYKSDLEGVGVFWRSRIRKIVECLK